MNKLAAFLIIFIASFSEANPLITAVCEQPLGSSEKYGISLHERASAEINHENQPSNKKREIIPKDGFTRSPTFIIDSNRKTAIILWPETPEEVKQRAQADSLNVPWCCLPPPAKSVNIISFTKEQITFIENEDFAVSLYSIYPELGSVYISRQSVEPSGKSSAVMSAFAKCNITWSKNN